MEIIEVLFVISLIVTFLDVILFCLISRIIYIKDCTIKLFLIWISSFSILVVISYLIDSDPIQLYFNLYLIWLMVPIFFILRIEERSYNYKYFFGFVISIILILLSRYLISPINVSILHILTEILYFIFIITFPKIVVYNKFIKNKSIKSPRILFLIIICIMLIELISGRSHEFFTALSYYLFLIAFLSIIFFQVEIKTWIRRILSEHNVKNGFESHSIKKIVNLINNKLYLLIKWDDFTKEECEKLREFLMEKFHFSWIKDAEIFKSEDNKIRIVDVTTKENLATIIRDDKNKNIYLKINDDQIYNLNVKVREENGRLNIYKNTIKVKPIEPIEPSDYYLCDKIYDAIINERAINVEKINLQSLRFMLVCANMKKEDILNELSIFRTLHLAAFALAIPPLIEFIFPFSEAIVKLQLKIEGIFFSLKFENFLSDFIENIFQFNYLFAMILAMIVIVIPILYPEELFIWFKLIMKKYAVVDLIYKVIVGIISIGLLIELLMFMEIIWSNVILFIFSILLMEISQFGSKPLNKQLIRNNKIILNLNERIINNESNVTKHS